MLRQRNIKLTLEYEGTRFFGFQKQKRGRTVQSELESALRNLFQQKIKITAAGRTDSGVHAEGQVVNFRTSSQLALSKIQLGLNHYLPEDLAVICVEEMKPCFHARFDAKWKEYEYRVLNSGAPSPLERRRVFRYWEPLNLNRMKKAAQLLSGRHDFRVFESSGGRRAVAVRTLRKLEIKRRGNLILFTIESNGFLYKMVRSMVGTLLSAGSGRLTLYELKLALKSSNRKLVGPTLSPQGLTLKKILY